MVSAASFSDHEYAVDVWEAEQGLPENTPTAMVQTPDGHLWFSSFGGLVRFDGLTFKLYDHLNTPELPGEGIVNLHLDRNGRLWISALQGLTTVKDGQWHLFWRDSGRNEGSLIRFFAESASGQVYATTFDGRILRFRDDGYEEIPRPPADPKLGFTPYVDEAGVLWVVNPQFIGKLVDGKWQEMIDARALIQQDPAAKLRWMVAGTSHDGSLWIATSQRLRKYRSGKLVFETRSPWPMEGFWSLYEDSTGTVWICSWNSGIYRFSPEMGWRHFTTQNGLADHFIRFVFQDREGDWWIGTNGGGLERFKRSRLINWSMAEGLPERDILSVATDSRGRIIIGTNGNGVVRLEGTTIQPIVWPGEKKEKDIATFAQSVLVDHHDHLWVGTSDALFRLDETLSHGQTRFTAARLLERSIIALFEDSRGRIWAGSAGGGGIAFDGNQRKTYRVEGGRAKGTLACFAESPRDGTIWACGPAGQLYRLQGEQFVPASESQELANASVNALLADKDGTLWIGTKYAGLLRLRDGHVARVPQKLGLPARGVISILDDGIGNFWFGSDSGLVRVPRGGLEAAIHEQKNELVFQTFNRSDGIASLSFSTQQPSAVKDRNGRVWFATERGAIMVDSRSLRLNTQPPPVAIEELLLDGQPISTGQPFLTSSPAPAVPVTVPPGAHRLEIHYAALSFVAADKLHFRYMLEGLDKEWIDVGERRVAYLQDLKPGRYRLHVKAGNNDGIWNDTGAFAEIYIQPHFYQTYWFLSICVLGAALVGMGAYRLRIKRMQQRERELEELVSQSARELQERKRVENELRRSEDKFAKAFHSSPASMSISSLESGRMIDVNEGFLKLFGFQLDEVIGYTTAELNLWESAAERERVGATLRGHGTARNLEARFRTKAGKIFDALVSAETVGFGGEECILGVVLDITEKKRLEDQLRQAQKMEAVGKLAGGVAHDFNNLLTVIKGYSELVLDGALGAITRSHVERIKEAAGRAAALIAQLLAFSRQQVLQPRAFNINSLVLNMDTMLRRLIGEDIEIVTITAPDLGPARADPGQIEQVIMNLAVNARDAMPTGGKLTLETANVELNGAFALEHPGAAPGCYAMLAVSDTGVGMDRQIRARIFEPFFTTKEIGKGTGLGLSMVYGIVKQSGGYISVYSEPGKGTTVKIYLPRADAPVEAVAFEQPAIVSIRGNETILLVEDDAEVRQLARIVLETCGYSVLMVDNPLKVSSVCEHYTGPIHLLLTDVVMPGLSGPELARQLISRWPAIKVLYMSGYTSEAIIHRGELDSGTFFLSKPFAPSSLAAKVREVLDESSVAQTHVKSK